MKKVFLFLASFLAISVSCSSNSDEKKLTKETAHFFNLLQSNNLDSLVQYYPDYDASYMDLGSDSIRINEIKQIEENNFEVSITNYYSEDNSEDNLVSTNCSLMFKKTDDKNASFVITDSKGLVSKDKVPYYAYSTGCVKEKAKYYDKDLIKRLNISNNILMETAENICNNIIPKHIRINYRFLGNKGRVYYELTNNSGYTINGFYISCYLTNPNPEANLVDVRDEGYWEVQTPLYSGTTQGYWKEPDNSGFKYYWPLGWDKIKFTYPVNSFLKYNSLTFAGTEYDEYVANHQE